MEDVTGSKRCRSDEVSSPESPMAKRLREDLFFDILDDDGDSCDRDPAIQELADVMKSLEEEIGLPAPETADPKPELPDLGFLFEASDDELGLPPAAASSSEEAEEVANGEVEDGVFGGQIWGIEEGIFEEEVGFGFRPEEDGLWFDGGLFEYSDGAPGPSDFGDFSWRAESLPAV